MWKDFVDFLAGGGAGACAKTAVAPVERVKVLQQVQVSEGVCFFFVAFFSQGLTHTAAAAVHCFVVHQGLTHSQYRGIWRTAADIVHVYGWRSLYCGNGANVARVFPVHAMKFGLMDFFKQWIADPARPSAGQLMLAGMCAGLVQQTATMPLEGIRTRLSVGAVAVPPLLYRGIWHCLQDTVSKEGVRGLYKGLVATWWSGVPYVALQMSFYWVRFRARVRFCFCFFFSFFCVRFGFFVQSLRSRFSDDWYALMFCGGTASIAAQLLTYPGDTVRKLMILNGVSGRPLLFTSTLVSLNLFSV